MKQITILFTVIALLVLEGCQYSKQGETTEKDAIKIGAIFSSTGVAGDYGKKSVSGVEMAVEMVNANGGINGKKVVVIYEDAKSSPKDALSAFRKLVDVDKTKIIVGDVYSSTTKVLIENLSQDTLLFAPGASKPDLVNINRNFLRNWTSDDFDGLAMANIVVGDSINEIATLTQVSDYTVSLNEAFKKEFVNKGGKISIQESFEGEKGDYRQVLNKLKSQNVKHVYLTALSKEMGTILKQSNEINFKPQWFTNLTVNTEDCKKIAGNSIEGVIFSKPFINFEKLAQDGKKFIDLYKERKGVEPDETVAHSFDAMNILFLALKNAGSNTPDLINYINNIKDYQGLSGKTTFDGKGGVLKDIEVLQMTNDKPKSIRVFTF
ncbi:MAG TPA: ABC transporter substrate-binding protein [Pyrinomonadaceae bacterium]|jgi:branched-chain amino acid transport system substrate-binding protein